MGSSGTWILIIILRGSKFLAFVFDLLDRDRDWVEEGLVAEGIPIATRVSSEFESRLPRPS
jgi:hypothetical protein